MMRETTRIADSQLKKLLKRSLDKWSFLLAPKGICLAKNLNNGIFRNGKFVAVKANFTWSLSPVLSWEIPSFPSN